AQQVQDMRDAGRARDGEPMQDGAPDQYRVGAQRQRLDDIGAPPDTAVRQHGNTSVDFRPDHRQNIEHGRNAVQYPPAMVRNDEAGDADIEGGPHIERMDDSLE